MIGGDRLRSTVRIVSGCGLLAATGFALGAGLSFLAEGTEGSAEDYALVSVILYTVSALGVFASREQGASEPQQSAQIFNLDDERKKRRRAA